MNNAKSDERRLNPEQSDPAFYSHEVNDLRTALKRTFEALGHERAERFLATDQDEFAVSPETVSSFSDEERLDYVALLVRDALYAWEPVDNFLSAWMEGRTTS